MKDNLSVVLSLSGINCVLYALMAAFTAIYTV